MPDSRGRFKPARGRGLLRLIGYNTGGVTKFVRKLCGLKRGEKEKTWEVLERDYFCKGVRKGLGLSPNSRGSR